MPPVFGPLSLVERALVVLRRGERERGLAVDQREEARLLAVEKFLDDDLLAGVAEDAEEEIVDRPRSLLDRLGDDHAFAGGKPVGLDHDRQVLTHDVEERGVGFGEAMIARCWNPVAGAEVLGEALGAFERRGRARRAEHFDALRFEIVGKPRHQRQLWSDHHKPDVVCPCRSVRPPHGRPRRAERTRRSPRSRHCPARNRAGRAGGFA